MKPDWVLRYLPSRRLGAWQSLGLAAVTVVLATAVRLALEPWVGRQVPFISYIPALLVLAVWCGFRVAAVACLVEASLAVLLFFGPSPFDSGGAWSLASFLCSGAVIVLVGASLSYALRLRAEAEQRLHATEKDLRTLVSELGHRAKNGLMVVAAIVAQSARGARTVAECEELITSRLGSMARAQDLVLDADGEPVELLSLLRTILTPYDWSRFDHAPSPPKVLVGRDVAIGIALLTNELATNAVKYGALSNDCGRILLDWSHAAGRASLLWQEHDGPEAKPSDREGFGTRLIQTALLAQGGSVERTFSARGVRCCARFPANGAAADTRV